MVEDRVTDGKRIAQLLSSELSGRDRGTLGDVAVVDADPDAEPSPEGTVAYGVEFRDERVGTVRIYPEAATLTVSHRTDAVTEAVREEAARAGRDGGLAVTEDDAVRIESGAAVKRAVDALVAGLTAED
ncbi:hypothetical protein ACFQMA_04860 [Halosimplex aquaticum]|uniref:DUF7993 domain-containing protein n=1 Tax=Halosimplex aquaticum TaxID=3026162 RepID=A0ABD5Y016_9EURY|nr:hypothetical protein [Halosimplex aquaticum]